VIPLSISLKISPKKCLSRDKASRNISQDDPAVQEWKTCLWFSLITRTIRTDINPRNVPRMAPSPGYLLHDKREMDMSRSFMKKFAETTSEGRHDGIPETHEEASRSSLSNFSAINE